MSRPGYSVSTNRKRYEMLALDTEHLRLSVLRKSEAAKACDYFCRNRDFHQKYSQTHSDEYFTVPVQKKYLAYDCESFLEGSLVPLWITEKGSDLLIGRVSFFNFAYGGMM